MPIMRLEAQPRSRADKTVPAQALAADDAFKEEGPVAFLNLAEGTHRRERISDQLAIDRNQAGRAGELHEFVKRGAVAHALPIVASKRHFRPKQVFLMSTQFGRNGKGQPVVRAGLLSALP